MNNKEIATIIFGILIVLYIIYILAIRNKLKNKMNKDLEKFNTANEEIDNTFSNKPITKDE